MRALFGVRLEVAGDGSCGDSIDIWGRETGLLCLEPLEFLENAPATQATFLRVT